MPVTTFLTPSGTALWTREMAALTPDAKEKTSVTVDQGLWIFSIIPSRLGEAPIPFE